MKTNKFLGPAALLTATVIWGTSFVVLKTTLEDVTVFWVLSIRFIIASVVFILICLLKHLKVNPVTIIGGFLMGVSMSAAYILQTFGLAYTTPGRNAFLTTTYCILVPFLAWLFYNKKPGFHNIIAAVVCLSGIGLISLSNADSVISLGDMLSMMCGLFFAFQFIFIENYVQLADVVSLTAIEFTVCAVISIICAHIFEPFPQNISASASFKIIYMGLICTALCFFLQAWGQQFTSSAVASVIMPLESVFGVLFSFFFYHEEIGIRFIIGALMVISAIIINEIFSTRSN